MNLADFMVLKDRRTAASKGISQLRRGELNSISAELKSYSRLAFLKSFDIRSLPAMSPRGSMERLDLLETLAPPLRKMNPVGLSPSSSASDLTQLKGKISQETYP